MNGAQAMVKCLENEGVEMVFGYPGVAICPFYDSLLDTDIKSVLIRTEQNAAHAASGLARVTGKVGVCAVTSGPGATNLITGIATAFADSIPLVCITGQVKSELIGSDVFQEADITGAVESFVKYSYLVKNVNDIPRVFREAFYIANTGRKGPVLIDIPIDIQNATIKNFHYPEEVNLRTYKPTVKGHAVQIKKVSDRTLVGSAPDIIRNYVELRGIGIIDVSRLFGMGAVKATEKIDLVINLEPWVNGKMYDRLGLDQEYTDIMGIRIPTTTIPVKPGRNLAIILEIAAMNNRQKRMGYNTAEEFNQRLMEQMKAEQAREALKKQSENSK